MSRLFLGIGLVLAFSSCDGANTGGSMSSGGSPGTDVGNGGNTGAVAAQCSSCGTSKCPTEAKACNDLPVCKKLIDCTVGCVAGDAACKNNCATTAANDSAAVVAATNYLACLTTQCTSDCFSNIGLGGAGNTNASSAGGNSNAGGSNAGGSNATGGYKATGGTTTVVYRCEGNITVKSCATCGGTNPPCYCSRIPGCNGTTNFTCGGTPTDDCTHYESFTECASAGCAINYDETSPELCLTPTCASLSNDANCSSLAGCKVTSSTVTCTGTPTPCSGLSVQRCTDVTGCELVAVP